ncbi:protein muscleblind isoform X7 [Phlebotomus argentipes]|uniref:protein muscleblind isoform X7 n=1 Tax=Phlebotomus argentipes TaxID=94469 RepID=UPI002892C53A|nr:protein muscleblind isoform X7 [Phlebotomus argentipes]
MATMVNMNNLLNGKDSRWLQLEVCREFQRNKCSRPDTECKFAHPPANVEVQNGRVTACYDSIKGRCNREKPPCKYFHPPQHLKDQLLINGRNHLALKNALMQQMGIAPGQPVIPGQVQTVDVQNGNTSVSPIGFSLQFGSQPIMATNPYLTGMPTSTYSHYFAPGHLMPTILGPDPSTVSPLGPVVPQAVPVAQQKIPRSDRLETGPVASVASGQILSTSAAAAAAAAAAANLPPPHAAPAPLSAVLGHPVEVGKKRAAENDAMFQLMDVKSVGSFYYDNFLLDTLPVCQDFNKSKCNRPTCKLVHLTEVDKVEVTDQRVAVCRDHANGNCRRHHCKYYHIPVLLPPASVMSALYRTSSSSSSLVAVTSN